MTNVEISIIVIAALIPIIALVIFLPKIKKSKIDKPAPTPPPAPVIEEKPVVEEKPVEDDNPRELFNTSFNSEDFKGYLTDKSKRTDRPTRKEFHVEGGDLDDNFFDDFDFGGPRRKPSVKQEDKPIAEQIQDLSPEIKALILTGVLDKKDY